MQQVRVQMFARFRDIVGKDTVEVTLAAPGTIKELREALANGNAELAALLTRSRIAVNGDFASETTTLGCNDEIALIPPVSGG